MANGYVDRFMAAERAGAIQEFYYAYSPENTLADTRYVFRDAGGTYRKLVRTDVRGFLQGIGY